MTLIKFFVLLPSVGGEIPVTGDHDLSTLSTSQVDAWPKRASIYLDLVSRDRLIKCKRQRGINHYPRQGMRFVCEKQAPRTVHLYGFDFEYSVLYLTH
ncbi:hypothetical protein BaRGS_00012731, partial [Batillaria attramentaria]